MNTATADLETATASVPRRSRLPFLALIAPAILFLTVTAAALAYVNSTGIALDENVLSGFSERLRGGYALAALLIPSTLGIVLALTGAFLNLRRRVSPLSGFAVALLWAVSAAVSALAVNQVGVDVIAGN